MRNLARLVLSALIALALLVGIASTASAAPPHRPCQYEDSNFCVWDAKHMGNGSGRSYIVGRHGKVHFVKHARAHRLIQRHARPVGTLMVGDSMTYGATAYLKSKQPSWHIDGQWGRGVTQLPVQIDRYLADNLAYPRTLIVALGTNRQAGWSEARYRAALAKVPASTRVVFVTTYHVNDPANEDESYSQWMRNIDSYRSYTQIADWRSAAQADPTLVRDGTHQSDPRGIETWGNLVLSAFARVGG